MCLTFFPSAMEPGLVTVAKECPLVPQQAHISSTDPPPGLASKNSFTNLSMATAPPLNPCICLHCLEPMGGNVLRSSMKSINRFLIQTNKTAVAIVKV